MGNKGQWRVRVCDFFSKRLLMILTVLSIVLGFTIGFVVRPAKPSADALMWMGKNISNTGHGLTSYTHPFLYNQCIALVKMVTLFDKMRLAIDDI